MDDTIEIVISFLIAVIIFFIFPVYIAYEKKDDLAYALSTKYVSDFVEEVKTKGYISADMYLDLQNKLISTGNTFDIYLEHKAKKVYPDGAGNYQTVTEIYTDKQILETLGIYDEKARSSILGQISFKNILANEGKTYSKLSVADIPLRANLFSVRTNYDGNEVPIYTMNIGDEFNIRVRNNNVTIAASLFNTFSSSSSNPNSYTRIYVNYGAVITSEKYWN